MKNNRKTFDPSTLPSCKSAEGVSDVNLRNVLMQMSIDAQQSAENGSAILTQIPSDVYDIYKTVQGLRCVMSEAISDPRLNPRFKAEVHSELYNLIIHNPYAYLDDARHILRSLIRERSDSGMVFTKTREAEINTILQCIKTQKRHVIIEGATGLGKTVLAEEAVKRYLIEKGIYKTQEFKDDLDPILESSLEENLSLSDGNNSVSKAYDFDGNFIMINAASATYEQLFGQMHILPSENGSMPVTKFIPGVVYLAAEKGLPIILEEYNTVKDARVLKGLQTLMSADSSTEISLEIDPNSGKIMTIKAQEGFTMVLTGNPVDKGSESLVGVVKSDSAIESRCLLMNVNQLSTQELLQQFLVSENLLDTNLGVYLPENVYFNLVKLVKMSVLIYQAKRGESVLSARGLDSAGLNSQKIMDNLLSSRTISVILDAWKSNDYIDSIEDVILKVYLSKSAGKKDRHEELKFLYSLFNLNGFFVNTDLYPSLGDTNLVAKLKSTIDKISLLPLEQRSDARYDLSSLELVQRLNSFKERYEQALSSPNSDYEYTSFVKVFEDCFGKMPSISIDIDSTTIQLDMAKVNYLDSLFETIIKDDIFKAKFEFVLGDEVLPGTKDFTYSMLLDSIKRYKADPNSLEISELETLNQILIDCEFDDDIEFETDELQESLETQEFLPGADAANKMIRFLGQNK